MKTDLFDFLKKADAPQVPRASTPFNMAAAEREALLPHALKIAREAGAVLMHFYEGGWDSLNTEIKGDNSPVTAADKASHEVIVAKLAKLTPGIAIISEENKTHPEIPASGLFWTVDPLDGTKEFLGRTGAFTVNITLMDNFRPVLGIIYNPAFDIAWYSLEKRNSWRQEGLNDPEIIKLPEFEAKKAQLTALFNRKHGNFNAYSEARMQLSRRGIYVPFMPEGKSGVPRAIQVAEGKADAFVDCGKNTRLIGGNGYSWDYAPGFLILKNAGGMMAEIASGKEPSFEKPTQRMNAYVALGSRALGKKAFPAWEKHCQ